MEEKIGSNRQHKLILQNRSKEMCIRDSSHSGEEGGADGNRTGNVYHPGYI